ncbi:MAG: polysaccharide deacetylase family protein, partial [Spirochaetes bacterium]|nr:polysaccharide deacetylase family protein [Spirochaetota bacterium]
SNSRYRITQEFITQGLARNEDEFNNATGRELSLLWHPPFYRTSDFITSAAAAAGYRTVIRTVDPGDWLSKESAVRFNIRQTPASQMVEFIMDKKQSDAVIPIRLGLLPGGRDDYLFQRIEVLLDALIRSGVKIVPVSALIK